MKKTICLLLSLLMALSLLPALAMEGDGLVPAPEGGSYLYCFLSGNDLMAASEDALYIWHPGSEEAARVRYELPEPEENETAKIYPFSAGGKLYAIRLVAERDEDEVDYRHTALFELTLNGDTAEGERLDKLDWEDLLIYDDDDRPIAQIPLQILDSGDTALLLCSDAVAKLDIEDVSLEVDTAQKDIACLAPYRDGKVLLLQHPQLSNSFTLLLYDPGKEEADTLCSFNYNFSSAVNGLAYDSEKDMVYLCRDGEVCPLDVKTGEFGQSIVDIPNADNSGTASAWVLDGVYAMCNKTLASRVLYDRPEVSVWLRVNDSSQVTAVEQTVKRFNDTHDTVRVNLTRDRGAQDKMLEALVRQDDTIDIYVLNTSMPSYDAVFNRGYLMPLNDSAAITELVGEMYPGIRKALTRNGKIQVLPVRADAYSLGVNLKVLDKLGLSPDDIPDNWDAFLDYLPTLAEPLSEYQDVRLIESAASINEVRLSLLGLIFNDYNYYNSVNGIDAPYNAEPLRSLANKLSAIDFEALGYELSEDENLGSLSTANEEGVDYLFSAYSGCTPESYRWQGFTPLKMRLTPEHQTCMVIDCMMAGVNPYTSHPAEALEFMEILAAALGPAERAALIPTYNETVRGAINETFIRNQREIVAQLETQLENASDRNRPLAQSELNQAREELARLEENASEVSAAGLEWYRSHDDNLMLSGVNWLNNQYTNENQQYLIQYCAGRITGEQLLAGFDKTTDMIRREGN